MLSTYSIGKTGSLAALLGVLAAIPAAGQFAQDPPPELSFLSTILKVRKNIPFEVWGEVKFPPNRDVGPARQGKHWFIVAEASNGADMVAEWNKIKPAFLQNGWTIVKEYRVGGLLEGLQYAKNGVQAWANVDNDFANFRLDVIEIAPLPFTLTLVPPAATPEKIESDKGDFPYLGPLPGSKFHRGGADNTPFRVTPKGATEAEIVANGTLYRDYDFPEISNVLLTTAYRDALTRGGWTIVQEGLITRKGAVTSGPWCRRSPAGTTSTWQMRDWWTWGQTWRRRATWRFTACCSTSTSRPFSRLPT